MNRQNEIKNELAESQEDLIEQVVEKALLQNRELLIHEVSQRLLASNAVSGKPVMEAESEEDWIKIESMSRLRAHVGGRFQNLKERWTKAGLPLREHRGDKAADFSIDQVGWLELSNWVAKQGYEVRLLDGTEGCLFEIRKRD